MNFWTYQVGVMNVVDADTIDFAVDLGFGIEFKIRTRLLDIDAPERGTPEADLATEFVQDWLDCNLDRLVIETFKDRTGKYGRYLVRVFGGVGGECLNDELIICGYANVYEEE